MYLNADIYCFFVLKSNGKIISYVLVIEVSLTFKSIKSFMLLVIGTIRFNKGSGCHQACRNMYKDKIRSSIRRQNVTLITNADSKPKVIWRTINKEEIRTL